MKRSYKETGGLVAGCRRIRYISKQEYIVSDDIGSMTFVMPNQFQTKSAISIMVRV